MIRGTTPTFKLTVTNGGELDLTAADEVFVTIRQREKTVTKTGEDIFVEPQAVSVWLEQKDSLRFAAGPAEVQINWTYMDQDTHQKRRAATKVKTITIAEQLLERTV